MVSTLARQMRLAQESVKTWPGWMRRNMETGMVAAFPGRSGVSAFPLDEHGRHSEYPFPDVSGVYGYCPACKRAQGDASHAWIHACTLECQMVAGVCTLKGRAVFMCQRPEMTEALLATLVSIDGHPPKKPIPPENLVFKASQAPKMPTKKI